MHGQFFRRKTWVEFLAFLQWIRRRYPGRQVLHIVLDNYGPHLKTEVREWAAAHHIRFYFTPTQASWLNRIECHFAALKRFALEPSDFRAHAEQQQAIDDYLSWRNGYGMLSMTNWKSFKRRQRKAA